MQYQDAAVDLLVTTFATFCAFYRSHPAVLAEVAFFVAVEAEEPAAVEPRMVTQAIYATHLSFFGAVALVMAWLLAAPASSESFLLRCIEEISHCDVLCLLGVLLGLLSGFRWRRLFLFVSQQVDLFQQVQLVSAVRMVESCHQIGVDSAATRRCWIYGCIAFLDIQSVSFRCP